MPLQIIKLFFEYFTMADCNIFIRTYKRTCFHCDCTSFVEKHIFHNFLFEKRPSCREHILVMQILKTFVYEIIV